MNYAVVIRSLIFICFLFSTAWTETKFINGYNDGLNVYVTIKSNGHIYKTDEMGPTTNTKLWNQLSDEDKKKVLHYYYLPGSRKTDFGSGATEMAKWANDSQGWTKLIEALKQKRANKSYPNLKAFYSKPPKMPSSPKDMKCTEQIINTQLNKEIKELEIDINENYNLGKQIYQKLIDIKWNQIGVAVKGVSGNLIPVIIDNFMTSFITNGASHMSQAITTLYSFANSTIDFAKNRPNDAAELIKRIGTLCDMMETDAKNAQKFVEQDIKKLQKKYEQLAKLCKQDFEDRKKFEKQKRDAIIKAGSSPTLDTGLKITSNAKTKEKREQEIREKAESLLKNLYKSLYKLERELKLQFQTLSKEFALIKQPRNPSFCGNKQIYSVNGVNRTEYAYKIPTTPNDSCFSMSHTVEDIKSWKEEFSQYIFAENKTSKKYEEIKKRADKVFQAALEKLPIVQGKINEVINKYRKYLPSFYHPNYSIGDDISYFHNFINKLDKSIKFTKARLKTAKNGKEIIDKGLKKRVEREKSLIRPYTSLEDNFVNSLIQIRDAIARIDKIYKSYQFIDLHGHIPRLNETKLNQLIKQIDSLPTTDAQKRRVDKIVKKLQKDQIEIRHQIKRLIIGQNNATSDLKLLNQFLTSYTGMGPNFPQFVKKDVKEVTGITIKSPYYDIVEDWSNGDPALWMQGKIGDWFLKPDYLLLNIDQIVSKLQGENKKYRSLEDIYRKVQDKKTTYLSMSRKTWAKTFNKISSELYMIAQSGNNGIKDKKVNEMYTKVYNLLNEINETIINKERILKIQPILKQDIKDAKNLLSQKSEDNSEFETMIERLQNDTKEGSEAYYAKNSPAIAPLFEKIEKLIVKLKESMEKIKVALENEKIEKIKNLYREFKEAYESKDKTQLLKLISNDWTTAQGGDISDLEENLVNVFKIFDEIEYKISNLEIRDIQNNRYMVLYNIDIIGEIYDDDITHEERSSVREEVGIENGKVKILRTLGGRYWSIK